MKKQILILIAFLLSFSINAQTVPSVGVGTDGPDPSAALDVMSKSTGVLIPRMYDAERNAISNPVEGLTIVNLSENCLNYYNGSKWKSVCGDNTPAVVIPVETATPECADWQDAFDNSGRYIEHHPTTSGNEVYLPIEVTSEGSLSITIVSHNGYTFSHYSPIVSVGKQTVKMEAGGTPATPGTNALTVTINGVVQTCQPTILVEASITPVLITTNCGSARVNGRYIATLTAAATGNNISLTITNTSDKSEHSYHYYTDPVDGVSFELQGVIPPRTTRTIYLLPTGTFTTPGSKSFTIKSTNTIETTNCKVSLNVEKIARAIKFHAFGLVAETGFNVGNATNNINRMLTSPANFGAQQNSTVLTQGVTITWGGATASSANIQSAINAGADVILIHYISSLDADAITTLTNFINNQNGVVITGREGSSGSTAVANLVNRVFGTSGTTSDDADGLNTYPVNVASNDVVLKGPFLDITAVSNPYVGNDGEDADVMVGYPSNAVVLATNLNNSRAYILRHPTKGLLVTGDGGTFAGSSGQPPTNRRFPMAITGSYTPTTNTMRLTTSTTVTTYNSYLFGNFMAWAIEYLDENK